MSVFKFSCISCSEALKGSATTLIFLNLRDKPCAEVRGKDISPIFYIERYILCQCVGKSFCFTLKQITIHRLHGQLVRSECGGESSEMVGGFDVTFMGCRAVCELVICLDFIYYPVDY